jgi:hypothetical protein
MGPLLDIAKGGGGDGGGGRGPEPSIVVSESTRGGGGELLLMVVGPGLGCGGGAREGDRDSFDACGL